MRARARVCVCVCVSNIGVWRREEGEYANIHIRTYYVHQEVSQLNGSHYFLILSATALKSVAFYVNFFHAAVLLVS